jgi:hypothetical protein
VAISTYLLWHKAFKNSRYTLLQEIGFLDFKKMNKAAEIGDNYTKQLLEQIDDQDLLTALQGQ